MDEKGLDVYVHGTDSGAARAYMENFRDVAAGILSDLHIDAAEMIYYTRDCFEGKISCKDAMEQITERPQQELFIPSTGAGKGRFVSAEELLGSVYEDWEKKTVLFQSSRERDLDLQMKELDLEEKRLEIQQKHIDTDHHEKAVEAKEQHDAAENRKLNAEAGQVKAETQKTTAEASQARAEAGQIREDITDKRYKAWWRKWLVRLLVAIIMFLAAFLIVQTIRGSINWQGIMNLIVSLFVLWLVKTILKKE